MTIDFNIKDSGTRCQEPKYILADQDFPDGGGERGANPRGASKNLLFGKILRKWTERGARP